MVLDTKVFCKSPNRCGTMFSTNCRKFTSFLRVWWSLIARGHFRFKMAMFFCSWNPSTRSVGPLGNHTILGGRNMSKWWDLGSISPFRAWPKRGYGAATSLASSLFTKTKQAMVSRLWFLLFPMPLCPYPPSLSIRISSFPLPSRLVQAPPLLS